MPDAYPKHYLTDVPHQLRRRILDLCVARRWNEAYALLQASGFTHYEPYELVWFDDWAPTTLEINEPASPRAAQLVRSGISARGVLSGTQNGTRNQRSQSAQGCSGNNLPERLRAYYKSGRCR